MAKINLESLSIEELAALRDEATDKLAEKVAARQAKLAMLSRYGKITENGPAAAKAKPRKEAKDAGHSSKDQSAAA
ncbi:hypothetical protein [Rhodopseudomonas sp. BR0G17]|uniref:hypothetical protein n=1 Tax=Rhodopseudomonas sp. BR0G17 TaxID=2269368 RepID=UPI0013DEBA38|nr:hypothetical protein [Rhodopseudomonas sp. BR0G17]NEW95894.1 hypothetical protein [Rhodopseudomonas sp. BR0G17]